MSGTPSGSLPCCAPSTASSRWRGRRSWGRRWPRSFLGGNPHATEVVPYLPDHGGAGRRRVLERLAGRRFDAALCAFARRPESRWLAKASAAAGVPWRINLEYFDPALSHERIPPWLTHEGWCVWGSMPSPRMLLHLLDPLLAGEPPLWTEDDRRVEMYVSREARRQADESCRPVALPASPSPFSPPAATPRGGGRRRASAASPHAWPGSSGCTS